MSSLGDYDRWKTDPDWGVREEKCQHCGGVKDECERLTCGGCGTDGCSGNLLCAQCDDWPLDAWQVTCARCGKAGTTAEFIAEEGDEWECAGCNRREDERERREQV